MRILHICCVTDLSNGITTVLKSLSAEQRKLGNSVRIFSILQGEPDFKYISSAKAFCTEIDSDRPDIVIFHSLYYFTFLPLAIALRLRNIPYAIELHGALSKHNYQQNRLRKWLANTLFFNRFIKGAKSIIYLSRSEYENSIVKDINPRYSIIPNGCEHCIDTLPVKSVTNNDLQIVYIGRIRRIHKGLDILLKAIAQISTRQPRPRVKFVFYGDGEKHECEWFEQQIAAISDMAEYRGAVYREQKRDALNEADIFILTSRYEGMPMGVLEAISHGVPCILTPETNIGKDVVLAQAGWLTPCNAEDIASTIERAITDYHINGNQYRHNALELSKQYDWKGIAQHSISEYNRIIN